MTLSLLARARLLASSRPPCSWPPAADQDPRPAASAGGGDAGDATATTAVADDEPPSTLPPGAVAGLDDYDGDGRLDLTGISGSLVLARDAAGARW